MNFFYTDVDKDGKLTLKEFSKPDIMEEDPTTEKERDEEYKVREKEFVSAIDKNKDGVATKEEMMVGLTPC